MQIVVSILTGPARGRQVSPDVEGEDLVEALRLKIQTLVAERLDEDGSSAAPELQRLMLGETVLEDGNTLAQRNSKGGGADAAPAYAAEADTV
jgi:hypothetical protein